jgi:hypothetical protein
MSAPGGGRDGAADARIAVAAGSVSTALEGPNAGSAATARPARCFLSRQRSALGQAGALHTLLLRSPISNASRFDRQLVARKSNPS